MTPEDFCKACGGAGKILGQTAVYRCPKCKGCGWDPEKVKAAGLDFEQVVDTLYHATKPDEPAQKGKRYARR